MDCSRSPSTFNAFLTSHWGFTITELLIFIATLLGFSVFALPPLLDTYARQTAESYIQQLRQEISYARLHAVSQGYDVLVCPNAGNGCDGLWSQSPIQLTLQSPQAKLLKQLSLPPKGHQLYYNREQLQFRNDGSLNALQNGTFIYCVFNAKWHYKISVSQAGRSQMQFVESPCPSN